MWANCAEPLVGELIYELCQLKLRCLSELTNKAQHNMCCHISETTVLKQHWIYDVSLTHLKETTQQ